MKGFRISIKLKLVAALLFTTVLPFLLIVFMFMTRVESTFEQQLYETRGDIVIQKTHSFSTYISERKKDLNVISGSHASFACGTDSTPVEHEAFHQVIILCRVGDKWVASNKSNQLDWLSSSWFNDTIVNKRVNVSQPFDFSSSGDVIAFTSPIEGESGIVEKVAVGFLQTSSLSNVFESGDIADTTDFLVIDSKNIPVFGDETQVQEEEGIHYRYLEYSGLNSGILKFIGNGDSKIGFYNNVGIVEGAHDSMWKVVLVESEENFFSSITRFRQEVFIVLAFIFLISIGISSLYIISLSRTVSKIKKGAEELARGNLNVKINISSGDEFGDLARTFNNMAMKIKEMYTGLEDKVTEKTDTLSEKISEMKKSNVLLEETKKAMLNVLEDLENEKSVLQREKAKDEAVLLAIGDGLVVTDQDKNILLVNKAFERLLGWSKNEVLNKSLSSIVRMEAEDGEIVPDKHRFRPLLLISGKKVRPMDGTFVTTTSDYYYVRKDKTRFPVVTTSTPIVIDEEVVGTVEVFRDVTEEKEIDRAKSEFVSLASHQLRTPLSTIKWYTEMLVNEEAGKLSGDQKKYMDEIAVGNERMIELVNALLNVSRIEMGTLAVDPQPTNIVDLANGVIDELKTLITEKGLIFKKNFEDNLPTISVDPKMVRVAIQNILTNAVKYTSDGGKVDFDIQKTGNSILMKITDSGIGIPQAQQSKIFTKLFRADNVKELDTQGTGLGLYIVKSIIDETGGKIWFKSKESKGTTFYVTIPLSGMKKKKGSKSLS